MKVLKQNNAPSPSPAPAHSPMRSPANNNDPPASVAPPAIAQPQLAEPDAQISASNVNEDGNDQDVDGMLLYYPLSSFSIKCMLTGFICFTSRVCTIV